MTKITTKEQATQAGMEAALSGMAMYDLTAEMDKRKVPNEFRDYWLAGAEEAALMMAEGEMD